MLKKYSLKALQLAINQAIRLDERMPEALRALDGSVLKIVVTPLNTHFFVHFQETELRLLDTYHSTPDTTIHSSPLGLIRLSLLPASKARSLFNNSVRIDGDVELGQQVKKLFDSMDIDWEGHLANFTGDVVAYQIGSMVRGSLRFKKHFVESMRLNVTEYVQEEVRLFPSRKELDYFYNAVDDLTLQVERLQAQLDLLKSIHETN